MKNFILSFVYKVLPEKQKEIFEAIQETENDAKEMGDSPDDVSSEQNDGLNQEAKVSEILTENLKAASQDKSSEPEIDFPVSEDL